MSSNASADRLTSEQKKLWDELQVHVPKPSGDQTPQQAINLSVLSFLFLCDFEGFEPLPAEAAIRAEFVAAGVPGRCPGARFWEHLRRHPGYHWVLAPGANVRNWDPECFGRPAVYRMERRTNENAIVLGARFQRAFTLALELHRDQVRKGPTPIPYIAHLLGVTSIVIEDGGDEDEAIAALLHDAAEDQGGKATLARIRSEFGERVAAIVEGCSDTLEEPKPPWRSRKERYLAHLEEVPREILRVSLADKVHNARAILADYRDVGEELWSRFRGTREESLWYYRSLVEVFTRRRPGPLADELLRTVEEIEALVRD